MLDDMKAAEFERRAVELNPYIRRTRIRKPRPEQMLCKGHRAMLPLKAFRAVTDAYCDECRTQRRRIRQDPMLHAEWKRERQRARRQARNPLKPQTVERRRDPTGYREKLRARQRQRDYERRLPGKAVPTRPMPETCECCGRSREEYGKKFARDHEHGTDIFRGWLCHNCNQAIGLLGDTAAGVQQAVAYLERARAAAPEDKRWFMLS